MLGDDAGETERNGRLHVSFAYLIFFPLQLLFLPFLIRRLLDLELERRYKSFRNVNRSKKNKAGYTAQDAPSMRSFHLRK